MGEVSIKVSVRCRPFTIDDKLGVKLRQSKYAILLSYYFAYKIYIKL